MILSSLQSLILANYWYQIKQYLWIFISKADLNLASIDWYTKIKLLYINFINAGITNFELGKNILIDK